MFTNIVLKSPFFPEIWNDHAYTKSRKVTTPGLQIEKPMPVYTLSQTGSHLNLKLEIKLQIMLTNGVCVYKCNRQSSVNVYSNVLISENLK